MCPADLPVTETAGAPAVQLAPAAPFGGLTFGSRTATVAGTGKVQVPLSCPASSVGNCVGTDIVQTAGKVTLRAVAAKHKPKAKILTLGKGSFSIPAGTTKKVTIKLSHAALKLLRKKHKLKAKQTIVSHDNRNLRRTTTGSLTLEIKAAKRN